MLIEFNYHVLCKWNSSFISFQFSALAKPLSNQLVAFQLLVLFELLLIHPASKNCSAAGQLLHKRRVAAGPLAAKVTRGASRRRGAAHLVDHVVPAEVLHQALVRAPAIWYI